jgi:hypothetical protein
MPIDKPLLSQQRVEQVQEQNTAQPTGVAGNSLLREMQRQTTLLVSIKGLLFVLILVALILPLCIVIFGGMFSSR